MIEADVQPPSYYIIFSLRTCIFEIENCLLEKSALINILSLVVHPCINLCIFFYSSASITSFPLQIHKLLLLDMAKLISN